MATTFLQATQELYRRVKGAGAVPSSLADIPQEVLEVAQALARAHAQIITSHIDWTFLWREGSVQVGPLGMNPNTPITPTLATINHYDPHTFYYSGFRLQMIEWADYKKGRLSLEDQAATSEPEAVVIRPDRQILALPYPDATYTIQFDCWIKAIPLPINEAGGAIQLQVPDDALEALYSMGKMFWYGDNEAPQYMAAQAEFETAYDAMEDAYWPGKARNTLAEDQQIVVVAQ
jgi:hypothetical protein